ncbi:MAG: hypothetical protein WAS56_06960 [Saprospiraceae bacterium]|jgi:hypothetical protein|nr:hypothetical protein [Saprospiraceae bacterium]MBK7466169.1 hypothetical protein [Saprospiraceae bacterium]MBK9994002.1 hypothetical protein [Saprospiraceae bacterium]
MISHATIDQYIASFENSTSLLEKTFDEIEEKNSDLIDILVGSHGEMLSDEEMDYLVFLFGVVYYSFSKQNPVKEYSEEEIQNVEEEVWAFLNENNKFDEAIDHFYESMTEKEIVDFIEVSIGDIDDSEIKISESGRVIMLAVLIAETKLLSEV